MVRLPIRMTIGFGLLFALFAFSLGVPCDVAASDHPWSCFVSTNVLPTERGLWFDVPAGAPAGEAALLWFFNNQAVDETVGYHTKAIQVSTSSFPRLVVKAALSDGGLFRVGYALNDPAAPCVYPPALNWLVADADGLYRVKTFNIPAGAVVCKICMKLTDNADAIAFGRTSVLIDYIRLYSAAGAIGWREECAESP